MKTAIVLLSGGLDSATTLAIAKNQGFTHCHALSFDYGQRHRIELTAAKRVAEHMGVVSHRWIKIDLRAFGGSALTDEIAVPKDRNENNMAQEIPVTYVPARNTIFLAYALAMAEVRDCTDIFIGVNAVDYSGYPDCRPEFIKAYQHMGNLATRAGVQGHTLKIHTPLIDLTKVQIIQKGLTLGVDYSLTHSCYDPTPAPESGSGSISGGGGTFGGASGGPCGHCDSCILRKHAFAELGMTDPALK